MEDFWGNSALVEPRAKAAASLPGPKHWVRTAFSIGRGVLQCFKEDGGPSIAERINKVLIQARLRPFHAADNSRVPRWGAGISCAPASSDRTGSP
jgi:hypothetical protein